MKKRRLTIWVIALLVCFDLQKAGATVRYDFGGEHDIDFPINDTVQVMNNPSDEPTTVNLLAGGSVERMEVSDISQINISGGTIGNGFIAFDDSSVTVSGGSMNGSFIMFDNSEASITGGSFDHFQSSSYSNSSLVNTTISTVLTEHNSILTIDNILVTDTVEVHAESQLTIYSGSIIDDLFTQGQSQVNMFGGIIGDILNLIDDSVITLYGNDFNYGYGEITHSTGVLTGTLANGDPINNRYYVNDTATLILAPVPEPSTLLLLTLGSLVFIKRK